MELDTAGAVFPLVALVYLVSLQQPQKALIEFLSNRTKGYFVILLLYIVL